MPLQSGSILNSRYRILSVLGRGGFGAVYRAADMSLKRPCAVKENLDTSPEAVRQFEKEATILAQLSHPNLPRVLDHFLIKDMGQYLVMDFIEGIDLQTLVDRDGPVSETVALDWIGQIAGALDYLHGQHPPVIHRDIKPANIRVRPDGRVFLVDFGLVKIYSAHLRTTIGARAVTPGYSPPEQYGQGSTDPRTDIYALAATLYTLLTGREPQESVQRIVQDQLKPIGQINMGVRADLTRVVSRAMSLDPSQRYTSVSLFVEELKKLPAVVVKEAAQPPRPTQPLLEPAATVPEVKKPLPKKPWFWVTIAVSLLAVIIISIGFGDESVSRSEPTEKAVVAVRDEGVDKPTIETESPSDIGQAPPTYTPQLPFTEIPLTNTVIPATNTSAPPTSAPISPDPEFTASENMFCRDGPGPDYEDHTMVYTGEILPVIARWSNGWFLVGIDNPNTRTRCCWVGGEGDLNVSLSSVQEITYLVDRITCQPR
jgi:serine/threonine protein kinase